MGVRRHHHHAVALVRQVDVVDIAAAAGDEAWVFDPGHRLTDAELVHLSPPRGCCERVKLYRRMAAMRMADNRPRPLHFSPGRPMLAGISRRVGACCTIRVLPRFWPSSSSTRGGTICRRR